MKNKKKIIIISSIVVFLVIVGIVIYLYYRKKKKESEEETLPEDTDNNNDVKPVNKLENLPIGSLPMKYGQKSKIVGLLQMALNDLHQSGLNSDGNFGKSTEKALSKNYNTKEADYQTCTKIYNDLKGANINAQALTLFYNSIFKK